MEQDDAATDSIDVVYTGTRRPTYAPDGLQIHHLPMLEAVPSDVEPNLIRGLIRNPCTLVFYSQTSVGILADLNVLDDLDLSEYTIWAVGHKTAAAIDDALGGRPRVPDLERFEGLVDQFTANRPRCPVVAFSVVDSPRSLPERVDFEDVHQIPVYETCPRVYPRLADTLADRQPDWLAFTSSRGVRTFAAQIDCAELGAVQIAAIGPTTASALAAAHIHPDLVMDAPDTERMMAQIVRQPADDADPS